MSSEKFNVDQFAKTVFGHSVQATKASNAVPENEDFSDATLTNPWFEPQLQNIGKRLVDLMESTGRKTKKTRRGEEVLFSLEASSSNEQFDSVVDLLDNWLESVDLTIDRLNGDVTSPTALSVSKQTLEKKNITVIKAANVLRPQLRFNPPVDNSPATSFIPKLASKPHAIAPLLDIFKPSSAGKTESAISVAMQSHLTARLGLPSSGASVAHPYETELQALQFTESQMSSKKEQIYGVLENTKCTWVSTVKELDIVIGKLSQETEIAVDLEQHFFRSYQGFVCLMQLSTRSENFLVDTLELRSHMQKFNQVFCNPKIVKVLHGADYDIQWLQRDFGVYVVNMFDTGQAARVLDYPKKSLAYLLEKFCDIKADKQYQLADWRIRPLPKEMEKYAIQDTHYLLYMYDRIRNELAAKSTEQNNYVLNVLNRSRQLCLQVYEKPGPVTEASYTALYNKLRADPLTGVQLECFAELCRWRDELARQEDESPAFVLPNKMMYSIAQQMPATVEHLLSLCVPIPPLTRAYAHEITGIIHRARSGTLNTPGARGFYAITAVLRPEQNQNLHPQQQSKLSTSSLTKPALPFIIPSAPKARVDPANEGGMVASPVSRNGMFTKSVEEDTKKHNAALAACLDDIGKSFDPLFASRVAEAAGVFDEDEEEEKVAEEENAKSAGKKRGLEKGKEEEEPIIPQSLAEIHRLTQRNKRQKKKKGANGPSKPHTPLKFGTKSNPVDLDSSPGTFMRKIGWEEEAKKIHQAPSGQNRLVTDHKAEKKQSRRVEHSSQGFEITSRVKPAGKQGGKGAKGKSGFFVKDRRSKH